MALGLALAGTSAVASPPEDRALADALVIDPGATCLEPQIMLEHVRSWREHDRVDDRVAISVRGSSEDPRALSFSVRLGDEVVIERNFDEAPANCTDLHAVVGLAIAIALDDALPAELGIAVPEPPEPAEQIDAGEGDLPDFSDDETEPEPPRRRGPGLAVAVEAGAFIGITPRASFGALASLDIRPLDHFDVRIGALATHLPRFQLDWPGYDGNVDTTVAAGRLDLCLGTKPRRVRGRVCAGAAAGAAISAGRGYTIDFRRATPWFAALAGLDMSAHLFGPLALELRLEGVFPFQRTALDVRSPSGQLLARERFPVAGLIVSVGPRLEF